MWNKDYIPTRKCNRRESLGMVKTPGGKRFGTIADAFAHDSVYFGPEEYRSWYVVASVNRDSDALDRSNFAVLLKAMGGEAEGSVEVQRANHWACGWVDYLIVSPRNHKDLRLAIAADSSVCDYPILNEDHFSEIEDEDCRAVWVDCFNKRDRVDYFRRHGHGGSFRELRAAVQGNWGEAASILNCPSDLAHC